MATCTGAAPCGKRLLVLYKPVFRQCVANYALKKGGLGKGMGKTGQIMEKKVLPVETDPSKLVNYVCGSNLLKEGEDVRLKEDSEYPDWLWTLRLERKPIPLEEMDPNTIEYWKRLNKLNARRYSEYLKVKKPK